MTTRPGIPGDIERAAPPTLIWGAEQQYNHRPTYAADSVRPQAIGKRTGMSVQGFLGLLAASADWLLHPPSGCAPHGMVAGMWISSENLAAARRAQAGR